MLDVTVEDAAIRIGLALLVGALIGLEREWREKPAGLRTYALVCEGAALFMITSLMLYADVRSSGGTNADPTRIASTVVQGIGFLAGGVIFTAGAKVKGLTTAAGVWVTAAIGLLIGAGYYEVALIGTLGALVTLMGFRWFEHEVFTEERPRRKRPERDRAAEDEPLA